MYFRKKLPMDDEKFIEHLIEVIELQGYVNLTKKIIEHFPEASSSDKVFLLRKFI